MYYKLEGEVIKTYQNCQMDLGQPRSTGDRNVKHWFIRSSGRYHIGGGVQKVSEKGYTPRSSDTLNGEERDCQPDFFWAGLFSGKPRYCYC